MSARAQSCIQCNVVASIKPLAAGAGYMSIDSFAATTISVAAST